MKLIKQIFLYLPIVIIVILSAFLSITIKSCVNFGDMEYSDLRYEELTYEGNQEQRGVYTIYFEETTELFQVTTVVGKDMEKKALESLKVGDTLEVYYLEKTFGKYQYSICEMQNESAMILSFSDYKQSNQRNQEMGIVFCSIGIGLGLCLIFVYFRIARMAKEEVHNKLGKIKLEYKKKGIVIRVYNAFSTCSLVINGRVVDVFEGVVAGKFSLKGEVCVNGKKILVEAKMGYVNMHLYYNGRLVKKKFMGLG